MAYSEDKDVDGLTAITDIDDADSLVVGDNSDATETAKQITWANTKTTIKTWYDAATSTLTNKTIDLTDNTVTGTVAEFNTAISDATLSGSNTGDEVAADLTTAGVVELATATEVDTGTDATRAVTPDGLQGSIRNLRFVDFIVVDPATDVAVGTDLITWSCPFDATIIQDDTDVDYFAAYTTTAGTTGTMVVDIHLNGTTIMTTNKLDIETTEKDTTTAATQPDLTTTDISKGDIITIDVDAIHTTAAKGLTVRMAVRPD